MMFERLRKGCEPKQDGKCMSYQSPLSLSFLLTRVSTQGPSNNCGPFLPTDQV